MSSCRGCRPPQTGLWIVDQVVAFRHVFRNAKPIDKAVDEILFWHRLAKVIQLSPDSVEVLEVASQGVAGLDGAV